MSESFVGLRERLNRITPAATPLRLNYDFIAHGHTALDWFTTHIPETESVSPFDELDAAMPRLFNHTKNWATPESVTMTVNPICWRILVKGMARRYRKPRPLPVTGRKRRM